MLKIGRTRAVHFCLGHVSVTFWRVILNAADRFHFLMSQNICIVLSSWYYHIVRRKETWQLIEERNMAIDESIQHWLFCSTVVLKLLRLWDIYSSRSALKFCTTLFPPFYIVYFELTTISTV